MAVLAVLNGERNKKIGVSRGTRLHLKLLFQAAGIEGRDYNKVLMHRSGCLRHQGRRVSFWGGSQKNKLFLPRKSCWPSHVTEGRISGSITLKRQKNKVTEGVDSGANSGQREERSRQENLVFDSKNVLGSHYGQTRKVPRKRNRFGNDRTLHKGGGLGKKGSLDAGGHANCQEKIF